MGKVDWAYTFGIVGVIAFYVALLAVAVVAAHSVLGDPVGLAGSLGASIHEIVNAFMEGWRSG